MITCPVNDWTCPCFDSEGCGKCRIKMPGNEHLNCEFLQSTDAKSIARPAPPTPQAISGAIVRAMFKSLEV